MSARSIASTTTGPGARGTGLSVARAVQGFSSRRRLGGALDGRDGPYLLSSSIWPVIPHGPSADDIDAGSSWHRPGYAVESASLGVARRGTGRP
jgi:hypothetical protein